MNQQTELDRVYRYVTDEIVNPTVGRSCRILGEGSQIDLARETLNIAFRALNKFIHSYKDSPDFTYYEETISFWLEHLDFWQNRIYETERRVIA